MRENFRKMMKARENFEYRVAQPSRELKDFLEYIKYERSLISLTKERTKSHNITVNHTIITLIANRMKQLYAQALSKFPQNTRFWDEYIKFLQQFKFQSDISATFDRMLQVNKCLDAFIIVYFVKNFQLTPSVHIECSSIVISRMFGSVRFCGNTMKTFKTSA